MYPLLDGDRCCWLAADFDGPASLLDAINYIKAAWALHVPAALELSRSGTGAHAWISSQLRWRRRPPAVSVPGCCGRRMALHGQMSLASYDRLFPSQDVLPAGGIGSPIVAPLYGKARKSNTTVFLDLTTLEPDEDQWGWWSRTNATTSRRRHSNMRSSKSRPGAGSALTATPYRRDKLDDLIALQSARPAHYLPSHRWPQGDNRRLGNPITGT